MINRQLTMGTPWGGGRRLPSGDVDAIRAKAAQLPYLFQQQRENEYRDASLAQSADQFNRRLAFDREIAEENEKNRKMSNLINYGTLGVSAAPLLYTAFIDDDVQKPVEMAVDTAAQTVQDTVKDIVPDTSSLYRSSMNYSGADSSGVSDFQFSDIPTKIWDTTTDFFSGVFDSLFG